MWKKEHIDLGDLPRPFKKDVVFEYQGPLKIKSVKVSCGCTAAKIDGNLVNVGFTGRFSNANTLDFQNFNKSLTVFFTDGTASKLTFSGKMIKNV